MGKNIGHREHRGKIWNIPDLAMEVYIDRWDFFSLSMLWLWFLHCQV
jgi:hypothetical protein